MDTLLASEQPLHPTIVSYLIGQPLKTYHCSIAAGYGRLDILKWLKKHGVDRSFWEQSSTWNEWVCTYAARGGHLKVLKWLRKHGAPWNEWTCAFASKGGHLKVLKWARKHGAPWDELVCAFASRGGHFKVLIWLRKHGAPWDKEVCSKAVDEYHWKVGWWALQNGCPCWLVDQDRLVRESIEEEQIRFLSWWSRTHRYFTLAPPPNEERQWKWKWERIRLKYYTMKNLLHERFGYASPVFFLLI